MFQKIRKTPKHSKRTGNKQNFKKKRNKIPSIICFFTFHFFEFSLRLLNDDKAEGDEIEKPFILKIEMLPLPYSVY